MAAALRAVPADVRKDSVQKCSQISLVPKRECQRFLQRVQNGRINALAHCC